MTVYDSEAPPPDEDFLRELVSPSELDEALEAERGHTELIASELALTLDYEASSWEECVLRMVTDLSSVIRTLGHRLTETNLEIRDLDYEYQHAKREYETTLANSPVEVVLQHVPRRRKKREIMAYALSDALGIAEGYARELIEGGKPVSLGIIYPSAGQRLVDMLSYYGAVCEIRRND